MRKLHAVRARSNKKLKVRINNRQAQGNEFQWPDGSPIDSEHMLISLLLPTAVKEFFRRINEEVEQICGRRYEHEEGLLSRWGNQGGSIYLGGQKVAINRPRVRDTESKKERKLETYQRFQDPAIFESQVFRDGLRHVSQRDYERGAQKIGGAFGFKKSTVSKHWKNATEKQLKELQSRDLSKLDIVALFVDGKRFRELGVVVALGVSSTGCKYTLGIYQANTENASSCLELLNDLERRGLPSSGLLFIVDGGSGLNSALEQKYAVHQPEKRLALRLRCHSHKWRNIEDALGKDSSVIDKASSLFWAMRDAEDLVQAREHMLALKKLLRQANLSALKSFEEAEPDLLLLHEMSLTPQLKRFFSTTNPIESLNSLLEEDLRRVKRWRSSEHFQRWIATAALNGEKRMYKVRGHSKLHLLKASLTKLCKTFSVDKAKKAA